MWCTRWFLPLLLLPLPTAPPYFLLLFLFSLTLHAKPCFYCIVLLTTLFVSSCYWQPFPLDSPLSTPWSDNITTFAEALNASLTPTYSRPLPTVMRTVDRCWCDFSSGGFFEPYNVSHWEYVSIQRLKDDLERQQRAAEEARLLEEREKAAILEVTTTNHSMPKTSAPVPRSTATRSPITSSTNLWSLLLPFTMRNSRNSQKIEPPVAPPSSGHSVSVGPSSDPIPATDGDSRRPLLRRQYDLRPYGLGLIVDLGWTR